MTAWAWIGIVFGAIFVIETGIGIVFIGIPLVREKIRRRKRGKDHE